MNSNFFDSSPSWIKRAGGRRAWTLPLVLATIWSSCRPAPAWGAKPAPRPRSEPPVLTSAPADTAVLTETAVLDEAAVLDAAAVPSETGASSESADVPVESAAPADPALKSHWQSTLILHAYGCLSSARLAEALTLAHQAPPPSDVTVHIIERVGNSVQIRLLRDHRELGQRDLLTVGETCPAVVEAAALLVTESLATLPAQPEVESTISDPAPGLPDEPPTETKPAVVSPPSIRAQRWMVIGSVGVGMMYSPRFTPQIEVLVGRHFGRARHWGAELRAGALLGWGRVRQGMPEGAHIAAQSWSGIALGCALFPQVLGLCLGATLGAIRGRGHGFDENFSSDSAWWTVVGQMESHIPVAAHWALHWTVRGQYSPEPPVFVIEQGEGQSDLGSAVPRWALQLQAGTRYWF